MNNTIRLYFTAKYKSLKNDIIVEAISRHKKLIRLTILNLRLLQQSRVFRSSFYVFMFFMLYSPVNLFIFINHFTALDIINYQAMRSKEQRSVKMTNEMIF